MPVGSVPANCREVRLTPIPDNYVKETLEDLSLLVEPRVPGGRLGYDPARQRAVRGLESIVMTRPMTSGSPPNLRCQ